MVVQLFEPLIEAVDGQEKRVGVGSVNGHGHTERATGFPHRIKAPIVQLHQIPRGDILAQVQSQRFHHLQSLGAGLVGTLDLIRLELGVTGSFERSHHGSVNTRKRPG